MDRVEGCGVVATVPVKSEGVVSEISRIAGEVIAEAESVTGLGAWELAVIAVALILFIVFFGGSGKGRGRRYRRGYAVAYRETLGREHAKMRAEHDREKYRHNHEPPPEYKHPSID